MVFLILTIAAISHFAIKERPKQREAPEQALCGMEFPSTLLVMSSRNMWLSIVAAVIVAATCIGIALLLMQPIALV